jgi:hypothetical protein
VVVGRVVCVKPLVLNDCTDKVVLEVKGELPTAIRVGAYVKCVLAFGTTKQQLELKSVREIKAPDLILHLAEVLKVESTAELSAKTSTCVVVE